MLCWLLKAAGWHDQACCANGSPQAHLTNYSINKDCENFQEAQDEAGADEASKRSLQWLMRCVPFACG